MKKLVIIRHADFQRDDPTISDLNRPLSKQGQRDLLAVSSSLIQQGIRPDVIVTSPALRTRESSELIAKKMNLSQDQIVIEDRIYEAERSDLLHIVQALDNSYETVFLVGHNPGVSTLYHLLINQEVRSFSTSCAAVIDFKIDGWREASFKHASMAHYLMPKDLDAPKSLWWRLVFWQRSKIHKVELFGVFFIGLILIIGLIIFILRVSPSN